MLFSSAIFLFLFLPVTLGVYFAAPRRLRNAALLALSLLFYAWGEKGYVLLIAASIALNYGLGLWLDAWRERRAGNYLLALAIASNVGLLILFKYANFVVANLNTVLPQALIWKPIHLPIGISFFTFEAIAYLVDIRRGETRAERNPIDFGLFMSLFPHLIAGPVVRYRDLAAAIAGRAVTTAGFAAGIRRFIIGLAKKVLIANTLARTADTLFALPPDQLATSAAWLGIVCYALHIYFDFSGYSDMAIGLGRLFGFELCENFHYPYIARSVTEFWRRWHISLSTWFRDYLYIPLGGNRRGQVRTFVNLMIVFMLCGLWHGASWTFLVWGLFHGLFLGLERFSLGRLLQRLPSPLRHSYALLAVLTGWVFFRSETLGQAFGYLAALSGMTRGPHILSDYLTRELLLALAIGSIACLPVFPLLQASWGRLAPRLGAVGATATELAGVMMLFVFFVASTMLLAAGTYNPFIYFRF